MKKSLLILFVILSPAFVRAQALAGDWQGTLKVNPTAQLRLVFHVAENNEDYTATLDSPDQGAYGIQVSEILFENPEATIKVGNLGITYQGKLAEKDLIKGTFYQSGQSFPLELQRITKDDDE